MWILGGHSLVQVPTTTPASIQYDNTGLQLKELQNADYFLGVFRETQSQQGQKKTKTVEKFETAGIYRYEKKNN